jgi:hypothetical protein
MLLEMRNSSQLFYVYIYSSIHVKTQLISNQCRIEDNRKHNGEKDYSERLPQFITPVCKYSSQKGPKLELTVPEG